MRGDADKKLIVNSGDAAMSIPEPILADSEIVLSLDVAIGICGCRSDNWHSARAIA